MYVYLGLSKTYGMQSIQKCCCPLVFKMPITNALIGGWSQTSVWLALQVWIYPQCNILSASSSVKCHVSCYNKVWALLKTTRMFKLLFGMDKYPHYKYRTTSGSWRWMNVVNKVCAGHWKMTPGLPGQHHEHGSGSNSWVGYTLHIWLRYQCHCTVLFMAHGQGYVPILTKWTRITGWSQTFCLLSTLSSSFKWAVKTCAWKSFTNVH